MSSIWIQIIKPTKTSIIMKTKFFGQVADFMGSKELEVLEIESTEKLIQYFNSTFPGFENQKFAIAVDNTIVTGDTNLQANTVVAFLPPFSGG